MKKPLEKKEEKIELKAEVGCGKHRNCCEDNKECRGMLQSIGGKILLNRCGC